MSWKNRLTSFGFIIASIYFTKLFRFFNEPNAAIIFALML